MSNREFTATRTMLANAMATAGAELLQYMKTAGALAAIPNTEPPQYVVAGTLAMIGKLLPAPAAAGIEGLTRYDIELYEVGNRYVHANPGKGKWVEFADVERLLGAHAGVPAKLAGAVAALQKAKQYLDYIQARQAGSAAHVDAANSYQHAVANLIKEVLSAHAGVEATDSGDSSIPADMAQAKRLITQLRGRVDDLLGIINEAKPVAAPAAQAPVQNAEEVRKAALEEAALAAEMVRDDYSEKQSGKWPELRDDAATGAGDCVAAIRALASKEAAAAETPSDTQGGAA